MNTAFKTLQPALQVLREVAKSIRSLEVAAGHALTERDRVEHLRQRARLLVALPEKLRDPLDGVDRITRQRMLVRVQGIASLAKDALREPINALRLSNLLINSDPKTEGPNYLEEIIAQFEQEEW